MRFKKLAVATGNPAAPWATIFNTMRGLAMYGHTEGVEVNVDLIDKDEPGCYYAWLEKAGMLKYVRPTAADVNAALGPDRALNASLGRLVRVRITRAEPEQGPATADVLAAGAPYTQAVQGAIRLAA